MRLAFSFEVPDENAPRDLFLLSQRARARPRSLRFRVSAPPTLRTPDFRRRRTYFGSARDSEGETGPPDLERSSRTAKRRGPRAAYLTRPSSATAIAPGVAKRFGRRRGPEEPPAIALDASVGEGSRHAKPDRRRPVFGVNKGRKGSLE